MKICKINSKGVRILNSFIDIDIGRNGVNKWFEIRICGLGIDLNYSPGKGWTRNRFAGDWFKTWLRSRKSDFLHWKRKLGRK